MKMYPPILLETSRQPEKTSLPMKMLNIFISPEEVFDEVAATTPRLTTCLVPTFVVYLMALALIQPATVKEQTASSVAHWRMVVSLDIGLGVFAGTAWSAFMIWLIGRVCLKARFPFLKAVEVASLSGTILVLGTIITCLLIAISGNPATRPSLSLLMGSSNSHPTLFAVLEAINIFHLWISMVLAVGLSKLSGVSFKECGFWVFGYWVLTRIALILLV